MKPDIVVLDRESPRKCSISPLQGRDDLVFLQSSNLEHESVLNPLPSEYLLLQVDGEPLSEKDAGRPLFLVDASWKRAWKIDAMLLKIKAERRSLSGIATRYPRVSKLYTMPDAGLASVEALYFARLIQGREDLTLLDHYYWKEGFLSTNANLIEHWRDFWKKQEQA